MLSEIFHSFGDVNVSYLTHRADIAVHPFVARNRFRRLILKSERWQLTSSSCISLHHHFRKLFNMFRTTIMLKKMSESKITTEQPCFNAEFF